LCRFFFVFFEKFAGKMKKKPFKKLGPILLDAFIVVGFCAVVTGCFMIYHPAAFIVGGLALIFAGMPKKPRIIIDKKPVDKGIK
jgi:hypothetical protein